LPVSFCRAAGILFRIAEEQQMRLLVTFLFVIAASLTSAGENARPNIVFCFADDWGRVASAYAAIEARPSMNQIVKTPNIDRVAKSGVLFRNAFVNSPSCTPCRSALLSGRYFFRTGMGSILQGATWDAAIPSFPLLMRDAGYHIGETWKVWSPGTPVDGPFGAGKYAYEKAGSKFNNFSENVTKLVRDGVALEAAREKMYDEVRGNFDAFLAARPKDAPFLYWFGPTNVHRAWEKGSGKALWNIDPESLKGKLPPFIPDVAEVREDFADYLGEIQAFDAAVGILLKKLEDAGELERTVVVLSGDHGMPGVPGGKCNLRDFGTGVALMVRWPGQPGGRVVDDFVNLMDLCPTFLELGGVKFPEGMNGRSIVPTLKSEKSGLVDPERTWVVTGRERHVATAREGNLPYPQRALRTAEFLYIRNFKPERWPMGGEGEEIVGDRQKMLESNTRAAFADMDASPTKAYVVMDQKDAKEKWRYTFAFGLRPAEELYDVKNDPDQINNLAVKPDDPIYAAALKQMRERLMQILTDAKDPRVIDDAFDKEPYLSAGVKSEAKK